MKTQLLILGLFLISFSISAQRIYTVAGNGAGYFLGDNVPATTTGMAPHGAVAFDSQGNFYIADNTNRIRKVDVVTGIITTVAGTGTPGYNGDGIPATSAQIYYSWAVAVDDAGNIYIGDYSNNRIRKVDAATGLISTIAGTGQYGYNGDTIPATSAKITEVFGIALDTAGNIYFSDFGNNRVRKIDAATGYIYTVAGNGDDGYNGDNIPAISAQLNQPYGIAVDDSNNVYIADKENNRIRKVSALTGMITTVAGSGINNTYNGDGIPAIEAHFGNPNSIALDDSSNMYISDTWNGLIYKVYKSTGLIYTAAGTMSGGLTEDGVPALSAQLTMPYGVNIDKCNNIYITLPGINRIRKVTAYDIASTVTNVTCYGMCNGSVIISPNGDNSPYTFSWSNGLGTNDTLTNLCAGSYTVSVTDGTGCISALPVVITQPSELEIYTTVQNATCHADGSVSVHVSSGYFPCTYFWSTGDTITTVSGLTAGEFYVTVTDGLGCSVFDTATVVNAPVSYASIPICMVTVDSLSQHNIIFWDKTLVNNADSFIVYREIFTNNYQPIASIHYDEPGMFIDTVSALYFPNTGNPNTGTFRYKLQVHDTCGGYSNLSPYHNTIYFLNNNGTFYWTTPYTIENGANPVSSYILMRDDSSNGNWHAVSSVTGTQQVINDPLYVVYANTASWRVKTQWGINCSPEAKNIESFSSSYSNIYTDNILFDLKNGNNSQLSIFPNPAKDIIHITYTMPDFDLQIFDMLGKQIKNISTKDNSVSIDVNAFPVGMYYAVVKRNGKIFTKKFLVE